MSLETKSDLNETTIDALQDLIQANIDSGKGFIDAAEEVDHAGLTELFAQLGAERNTLATELQQHVKYNGEKATDEGSWLASMHRCWIDLRAKLNGGDPHVILIEAERGEDHIKHAYEDALKETAGSAMNDVLTRQYAIVKSGHDKIRNLRDGFAKTK